MKLEISDLKEKRKFPLICAGISIIAYLGLLLFTPGYLRPFLLNKFWLALTLTFLVWQALGSLLFIVLPNLKQIWARIVFRAMFVLVFVCPNILIPIFAPFIATCLYIPAEFGRIIKSIFSWF